MTKLSIIYYSQTGTLDTMARRLAATAESLGAEVRLRAVGREGEDASASGDRPAPPTVEDVVWALRHPDPVRQRGRAAQGVHRHPRRPVVPR
jgi:hypothetical protein